MMRARTGLAATYLFGRTSASILAFLHASSSSRPRNIASTNISRMTSSISATSATRTSSDYFGVGITGASGLVGSALREELGKPDTLIQGKPVRIVRLVRGNTLDEKEKESEDSDSSLETSLVWNPSGESAQDVMDPTAAAQMDAIVHLSGESVATGIGRLGFLGLRPWSQAKKDEILSSRIGPTKALAKVVAASSPTRPKSFLVASGIGIYGDDFFMANDNDDDKAAADESYDTSATPGFLAEVSRQWEAASALTSNDHGNSSSRVVNMRFGVVLSKQGGALAKLYPIFWVGGGGNIGSGQQYFSFISALDVARAIVHTLATPSLEGPVNFSAPTPCTNEEFTKALGQCIRRPTIVPFPRFAVRLLFGEMGQEMLLGGTRAVPSKLLESGFEFNDPTINDAISSALEEQG